MELQDFQNLLLGFMSQDQNQMASSIIQNLIETQYPLYIDYLIQSIQQDQNERVFNVSITFLHVEVVKKRIFANNELAFQIVQKLTPIIAGILQSPIVQDNFKKIVATILAQLHIFVFHLDNNIEIAKYILTTFNEMPEIRKYLIHCLFEISVNDQEFGGFNIDDLISIITHNAQDLTLYMPIVNLFFAIAMRRPDTPVLQELFTQLFASCPEENLDEMLHSLSEFAEHSSSFFLPCLPTLTQQLCNFAANVKLPEVIRNKAMMCLSSISEGAPEMCQSTQEYFIPVFQTLIQIASEITDDSPLEYEPNNTEPYQFALDSIGLIFEKFDNSNIFVPIYQLAMTILSNPDITWQAAYAAISSLAEINMIALSYLIDKEEMQKNLFNKLSMFLDIESYTRTRIAVYTFISKLSVRGILCPQNQLCLILILPLESLMIIENNMIAKKLAYQAYTDFISQQTSQKNNEFFERFYPELVKELQTASNDFKINIVRLIGPLVKAAREDAIQYFPSIVQIAFDLMKIRDPNIQAEAIRCYSLAISYVPIDGKIKEWCSQFCQAGIPLLVSTDLDEESLNHLYDAIHSLLCTLDKEVAPLVPQLLTKVIQDAQKGITIEQVNSFDMNDVYKNKSIYYRIQQTSDSPVKNYASMSEITEVRHALLILDALIDSDPDFKNYIDNVYSICENWITNQYSIEPLMKLCWDIFDTILRIFKEQYQNLQEFLRKNQNQLTDEHQQQLIQCTQQSNAHVEIIFHCYINSIKQKGSPVFIDKVLKVLKNAISFARLIKWFNPEVFSNILQTIQPLIDYIFAIKAKKIKDMEEFHTVDLSNRSLAHFDVCLSRISDIISASFKLQPDITYQFYAQTIGPKTNEYLNNELTLIFGILTTTLFIIHTKNKDKMIEFCQILMKYSCMFDREDDDLPEHALYAMGKLFYAIPLENAEIANHFMQFFIQFFASEQIQNVNTDALLMISDYANVTFAKFLHANKDLFDHSDVVNAFLEAIPLFENVVDSDIYFQFMEELLRLGWFTEVCGNDWPELILGHIITGFATNQYKEHTRLMFAQTLRNILSTKEGKEAIIQTLSSIHPNKAHYFRVLINPKKPNSE
ncbi:importin subunit beta-3 [Tritrichomonas musculus]|uniref:Importin subunit beta-3 n=1 Tax=Tritrichomonas musculus TaxID=1915356 RepID=A0ABR2IN47_9EUKA